MENSKVSSLISRVNHRIILSTKFTYLPKNLIYKNKNIFSQFFCQEHTNYIKRGTPTPKPECEI